MNKTQERERFTAWLDPKKETNWIKSERKRMKEQGIKTYMVKKKDKVAICHKGFVPVEYY